MEGQKLEACMELKNVKQDISELMKQFERGTLTELEVELEDIRIAMKKSAPEKNTQTVVVNRNQDFSNNQAAGSKTVEKENGCLIKAPIVGTFYRAGKPGEPPFVKEGQTVKKGETIGLIEAMKIMNEIPAPISGIIVEILAEDGGFTAFDQPLMRLKEDLDV